MGCGLFHDETSVFRQILQLQLVLYCTGAHFTLFFHQNQIRWKNYLVVIQFLVIGSLHIFTHAMTAQLSCEEQKFATITISKFSKITLPSGLNYDGNSLVKEAEVFLHSPISFLRSSMAVAIIISWWEINTIITKEFPPKLTSTCLISNLLWNDNYTKGSGKTCRKITTSKKHTIPY